MKTSYHLYGSNAPDSAMWMVVTNVFQTYVIVMYSLCELLVTDVCNCDCSLQLIVMYSLCELLVTDVCNCDCSLQLIVLH
jgi:hypothetical protein